MAVFQGHRTPTTDSGIKRKVSNKMFYADVMSTCQSISKSHKSQHAFVTVGLEYNKQRKNLKRSICVKGLIKY